MIQHAWMSTDLENRLENISQLMSPDFSMKLALVSRNHPIPDVCPTIDIMLFESDSIKTHQFQALMHQHLQLFGHN